MSSTITGPLALVVSGLGVGFGRVGLDTTGEGLISLRLPGEGRFPLPSDAIGRVGDGLLQLGGSALGGIGSELLLGTCGRASQSTTPCK